VGLSEAKRSQTYQADSERLALPTYAQATYNKLLLLLLSDTDTGVVSRANSIYIWTVLLLAHA
jgi:hypothetical protein